MDIDTVKQNFDIQLNLYEYIPNGLKGTKNKVLGDAYNIGWSITSKSDSSVTENFTTAYGVPTGTQMTKDEIVNDALTYRYEQIFEWVADLSPTPTTITSSDTGPIGDTGSTGDPTVTTN